MSSVGNLSRPRGLKFIEQCGRFCDWNIPAQRMVFWLYDGVCGALLPLGLPMSRRAAETDWVVGVVGLEHTNACASQVQQYSYVFEMS